MTTLEHALGYIRRGWSVIPLAPGTKHPPAGFELGPYLRGEARLQEEDAEAWWTEHPDHGVGIVTGRPSSLVVVDVDPRNGGSIQDVISRFGDDAGFVVNTGGGGMHVYCRHKGAVPKGKIGEGVDRQADGGIVVAPPSIHPTTGQAYYVLNEGEPVACPAWALESESSGQGDGEERASSWIADTLAHPAGVIPGTQHETLRNLAWWAAGHLPEDIALSVLLSFASRLPLSGREWTEGDVASLLESAFKKREPAGKVAGVVDDVGPAKLKDWLALARPLPTLLESIEDTDWILPDLIAPGAWTQVHGRVKEGKSTLAYAAVAALLDGRRFLERDTRKCKVLLVTEQYGLSLLKTAERAGLEKRLELIALALPELGVISWPELAALIVEAAKVHGCSVVIVDTLARAMRLDDENDARAAHQLQELLPLRKAGVACIFIRHARKSDGDVNTAARGSSAIDGEMDILVHMTAPQGITSDYRKLETTGRLSNSTMHLIYNGSTYDLGEPPAGKARQAMDSIVSALSQHPLGLVVSELAELDGLPSANRLREHLDELVAKGIVVFLEEPTPGGGSPRKRYSLNKVVE